MDSFSAAFVAGVMNLARYSPILFIAGAFTLATVLEPKWSSFRRQQSASALELALGDGRRLFANHFITKADVYFHQGYYPSKFDQKPAREESHANETKEEHAAHTHHEQHEKEMDFLGESRDWIEMFGRHFFVSSHSHMGNKDANELLPWFKIASEMNPNEPEVYTTTAFWLRNLGKFKEAEDFLRQGWRDNPDSYQILLELGKIYDINKQDRGRARNLWELALVKWEKLEAGKEKPDLFAKEQLVGRLADLEEKAGNISKAIEWLEKLVNLSPYPDLIKQRIADLKAKGGK
jgi:tetratricopeptide (TPR) repeat protein